MAGGLVRERGGVQKNKEYVGVSASLIDFKK
jgi:hypothetical protein